MPPSRSRRPPSGPRKPGAGTGRDTGARSGSGSAAGSKTGKATSNDARPPKRTHPARPARERVDGGRPPAPARRPRQPATAAPRKAVPADAAPAQDHGPQRLAKLLARAGVGSRRDVERMVLEGRIAVEGTTLTSPALVLSSLDGVTVDGQPVARPVSARLYRFYKPAGVLTAARDPKGRKTIYDVLPPGLPRLVPVGRLDFNTEGLLLMTNDGELKRQLELPASGIERTYRARAFGDISQAQLEELIDGITIDGVRYGRIDANLERRTGRNQWVEMTLTEGKNREVRRILEHFGLQVSRLLRTAYGPFTAEGLEPGQVDLVPRDALFQFRRWLDKRTGAPQREG